MLGFGRYNPMPMQLGGGESVLEVTHQSILDALVLAWDTDDGTTAHAEAYADALAVTTIWMVNRRLSNLMVPSKMLESLTAWERACGLRPSITDTDVARRRAVAAKLRFVAGNAILDIEEVCKQVLGANFELLLQADPSQWITYWPGINPGPPGFEWTSNRAKACVRMNASGLSNSELVRKRDQLVEQLDAAVPAWMTFCVGVGTSLVCDEGILGQEIL